jgi:hypothetical protein
MQPCGHTRLMNYIIGMCKKTKNWINVISDLGYEVQIIEQTIHTSSGDAVKPDVVSSSNMLLHSLVFEVKGGKSLDKDQLNRYSDLMPDDLRWVTWNAVYDKLRLQLDVCVCDLAENHQFIRMANNRFPMLTFSSTELVKDGMFKNNKLNETFKNPISLNDKLQPLSYYPFSDEDDSAYIAMHVIGTILSIILKNSKRGCVLSEKELEKQLVTFDDIIASNFNYVWKALSIEHRNALKTKIGNVTRSILAREELKASLGIIQQRKGYRVTRNLDQFQIEATRFIEELESQKGQTDLARFPH